MLQKIALNAEYKFDLTVSWLKIWFFVLSCILYWNKIPVF